MRLLPGALVWALVALAAYGQARDPDEVIAVVLGQEITVAGAKRAPITELIGGALTGKFVEDNGRAHYQQAGVQPFDAEREFLEEQEANGAFTILDPDFEEDFWHYWRNEGMHTFVPEGKERELLATPWWLMEGAADD